MDAFTTIDLNWTGRPQSIASLLIRSGDFAGLIDPGPGSTFESLRAAVEAEGLTFNALDAVLLTHIHLDHAGATGALVKENPRLKVYVHELGATHMADPSRLLASASRLYGGDLLPLYGECLPVPRNNLLPLEGGERIGLGELEMDVFYSPGHASHHLSYWHAPSGIAFVGDNAGICIERNPYLLPATPPPDIELELWSATLDTIAALGPERLFLTHFGYVENPSEHIRAFRARLKEWAALVQRLLDSSDSLEAAEASFIEQISREIRSAMPAEFAELYIFNGGLGLSWRGLVRYLRKKSQQAKPIAST
jgi:glyoxylase-like metal-dependent hydrolase (beta-lactamase superfamily II)